MIFSVSLFGVLALPAGACFLAWCIVGFALFHLVLAHCRGCNYRHLSILLLLSTARFGEAAHPGPAYTLGALNATGLQGKHNVIAQLPPGLFAASETHLTSRGVLEFNRGLHFAPSPFALLPGAPALPRSHSAFAGDYTGVGFISSCPMRAASQSWHPDVFATSRLQVAHIYLDPLWILAGVCYGFASGPPDRTLQLLEHLSDRVVDSAVGPRFIAGDFNLLEEANPFALHWQNCGFVEVQHLWARITGQPPRPTCKGSTRKDFLYLSAELVALVEQVAVEDDWFADHSLLLARLGLPATVPPRPLWRMPRKRPMPQGLSSFMPQVPAARIQQLLAIRDPAAKFAAVWGEYEDVVSHALVCKGHHPLSPAERGRGCTVDVSVSREPVAPLRKERQGEVAPLYYGSNRRYAQWFRQLRRLQALRQSLRKGSDSDAAAVHRASTWHAILHAPGFHPSFAQWWPLRPKRLQHSPSQVLPGVPSFEVLSAIFDCFEANFRAFESELLAHRRKLARTRRAQLPSLIFKDIQRVRSCPVTTLVEGPEARVSRVIEEDFSLIVEPEQDWDPAAPVFVDGCPVMPVHVEPDQLWLSRSPAPDARLVRQERHLATLPDLFRAFGEAWSARWLRHTTVDDARWNQALAVIDEVLPPRVGMPFRPLSLSQWKAAIQSKKPSSAPGPDGVSRLDLLLMPDDLSQLLLDVCAQAEHDGAWPMAAMHAIVSALEKAPGAERVGHFRPIAVLSIVYRVWASCRAREALRYLQPFCPEHMFGMLPGKSPQSVWFLMQFWIESSQLCQSSLCGVVADLVKAFNFLPRTPVMAFAVHMGLPLPVIRAWTAAHCLLQRRFKVRGCVGPPIGSTTGFPEGDPLSCVGMSLVCLAFHAHQLAKAPASLAVSYVDNWEGVGESVDSVCMAHQAMLDFCSAWDVQLDSSKTVFWATRQTDRRQLRRLGCTVLHQARELGGHLQFTRAWTNSTLTARIRAMDDMWPRLQSSHSPYPVKVRALLAAAWPRGLYGASVCRLGTRYVSHLDPVHSVV